MSLPSFCSASGIGPQGPGLSALVTFKVCRGEQGPKTGRWLPRGAKEGPDELAVLSRWRWCSCLLLLLRNTTGVMLLMTSGKTPGTLLGLSPGHVDRCVHWSAQSAWPPSCGSWGLAPMPSQLPGHPISMVSQSHLLLPALELQAKGRGSLIRERGS